MRKKKSAGMRISANAKFADDAPELTDEFFEAAEVKIGERVIRRGRPKLANPKEAVKLRIDADVLARYRKSGEGWQTRINADLRKALKLSRPAK